MRWLAVLMCLAACTSMTNSTDPATVDFLINSSASDFRGHGPAPIAFRHVRTGTVVNPDGTKSARLCGEFQKAGSSAWVYFATIKTSGYEQYVGPQPISYCQSASITWDKQDLSASLETRLNPRRP